MEKTLPRRMIRNRIRIKRHPVKQTALLYLREALFEERYEECAEFVRTALEFGATAFEVRAILEDPRRLPGP